MTLKGITYKKLISFLITSAIILCVMPFNHIFADSNTYIKTTGCDTLGSHLYGNTTKYLHSYTSNSSSEIRAVAIQKSNGYSFYLVSLNSFGYKMAYNTSQSCNLSSTDFNASYTTFNGVRYYYAQTLMGTNLTDTSNYVCFIPVVTIYSNYNDVKTAIYYTFGDGAVAPAPPIEVGELKVNYYTDFASTQQYTIGALKSNKDTIKWEYDSTNSNISLLDLKVDIRAVPNNYYSSTETGLVSLSWQDINLDISYASDLGSYQINNNQVSFTWEEVVNNFKTQTNLPSYFDTVINFWSNGFYKFYNNQYYAAGWVYQIRLNTWSGDYTGEWQTIYTVPSSPPEGQQTTIEYYVNGTGMTKPVYQNIQNINNQNNITNNTWYVNGSPYGINDDSGENWFTKLLEIIVGLVSDIISAITGLFSDVIKGIFDLISDLGINILDTFTDLWNNFINLFNGINFTDDNPDFDLNLGVGEGDSPLDIVPAFIRMMISSGLGYMLWLPLVVGIIFMIL